MIGFVGAVIIAAVVAVVVAVVAAVGASITASKTADANKYAADQARQAKETQAKEKTKRAEIRAQNKLDRMEARQNNYNSMENQHRDTTERLLAIDSAAQQLWAQDSSWSSGVYEANWDYGFENDYSQGANSGNDSSTNKA
ncbi:MAG: hypothetical protein H7A32_02805 [Deltaproteobacteria bacterium]|nr:hypothetical protein [Deltaproteobacteria bacterium]